MSTPTITLPVIHLNGTDVSSLLADCLAGYTAAQKLLAALPRPHSRDYYPPLRGAYESAVADHERRVEAVRGIMQELETVAIHLQQQQQQRSERTRSVKTVCDSE